MAYFFLLFNEEKAKVQHDVHMHAHACSSLHKIFMDRCNISLSTLIGKEYHA